LQIIDFGSRLSTAFDRSHWQATMMVVTLTFEVGIVGNEQLA
jgi:hypothetical protein